MEVRVLSSAHFSNKDFVNSELYFQVFRHDSSQERKLDVVYKQMHAFAFTAEKLMRSAPLVVDGATANAIRNLSAAAKRFESYADEPFLHFALKQIKRKMNPVPTANDTCAHDRCTCVISGTNEVYRDGRTYCSDGCADSKGCGHGRCGCKK